MLLASPLLSLLLTPCIPLTDAAAEQTWTGVTSNNWFEASNWDTNQVPTSALGAVFNNTTGAVSVSGGAAEVYRIQIGSVSGSNGSLIVTGSGSSLSASGDLSVGDFGTGSLNIADGGGVEGQTVNIGVNSGSVGTVTVTGAGSSLSASDQLYVGNSGEGSLTVADGGLVSVTNNAIIGYDSTEGEVTVTGAGSSLTTNKALYVGQYGQGTLRVEDGGKASADTTYVGFNDEGAVTVTGAGSSLTTNNDLSVGVGAQGSLNIEDGGGVDGKTVTIGLGSGGVGTATVTGAGSSLSASGDLSVGSDGNGTLRVEGGGKASGGTIHVGFGDIGGGVVTVTGAGSSLTTNNDLSVGNFGPGSLNIEAGGRVDGQTVNIGVNSGGVGTVTVSGAGSALNAGTDLVVGGLSTGNLTVKDSGAVSAARVTIGQEAGSVGVARIESGGVVVTGGVSGGAGDSSLVFDGGALKASGDNPSFISGLGEARLEAGGGVIDDGGHRIGITQALSGPGVLTKTGAGVVSLDAASSIGGLDITAGTLALRADLSVADSATVRAGATLDAGWGDHSISGDLANAGTLNLRGNALGNTLTVSGDYRRLGSQILINTQLGDDNSPTDKLVVGGSVTGDPGQPTTLDVQNKGGAGTVTINGIQVIEVGGTSPANAFALANGPSIPVGIYEYALQKGGAVTGGESWYLVSAVRPNPPPQPPNPQTPTPQNQPIPQPPTPGSTTQNQANPNQQNHPISHPPTPADMQPIYRPGAASYAAAQFLGSAQGFRQLYTLHQRVGEHRDLPEEKQTWARTSYFTSKEEGETRFGYDQDTIGLQIGQEFVARRDKNGMSRAAVAFDYSATEADLSDRIRPLVSLNEKTGETEAKSYALEGYYTFIFNNNAYLDLVGQAAVLRNNYVVFESNGGRYGADQDGWRGGVSGEVGYPLWRTERWELEAQGQLAYQYANYDGFRDAVSAISDTDAHSLRGRVGTKLTKQLVKQEQRSLAVYGIFGLVADLIQPDGVSVDNGGQYVKISEDYDPFYGEVGGGVQGYVSGRISLFADARYQQGFDSDNDRHGYAINAGLRFDF
ncbi:MAG: autotransporter outer membrane beta-barrel domain-containing protein [Desulfobulbaceae bacterium]|jgi:outer membrane autotransporter protein|nr:autotransporter outer membrane beta-barrel domain-containing protein [Desulfobulbaceae bacterium]